MMDYYTHKISTRDNIRFHRITDLSNIKDFPKIPIRRYRKVFSGLIYTALLVSAIWKRKFITDSVSMRFSDTNGTMEKPFLKKRSRYCLLPKYFCYKPFHILHRFLFCRIIYPIMHPFCSADFPYFLQRLRIIH